MGVRFIIDVRINLGPELLRDDPVTVIGTAHFILEVMWALAVSSV